MTRSSEQLAGDWEARIVANVRPIAWGSVIRRLLAYVAFALLAGAALFGFR
jgi:hypothetical protein